MSLPMDTHYYVNLLLLLVDKEIVWGSVHNDAALPAYSRKRNALGRDLYAVFGRQEHHSENGIVYYTQVLYREVCGTGSEVSKIFGSFLVL